MRIFISTGEVSGDLQGSILVAALFKQAAAKGLDLEITALGGDRMEQAGAKLVGNTTQIGSIGFLEAIPLILPTLKLQRFAKKYLRNNIPDAVVLIDYAAPNIEIGGFVKKNFPQVPITYYIAPQDWAVPMLGNAPKLTHFVDQLLAVFPQEARYYEKKKLDVTWVGHPLLDRMAQAPDKEQARHSLNISVDQQVITLLPASRRQEIKQMLPIFIESATIIRQKIPNIHFLIPVSLAIYKEEISRLVNKAKLSATILENQTLEAISAADLAITKSGTVNLEIALLCVPQIVLYRVHPFTAWIARNILKMDIPLMSPPNLILDREVVPEFQQELATPENIAKQALELLGNPIQCLKIIAEYNRMRSLLGDIGVAERAANAILEFNQQ